MDNQNGSSQDIEQQMPKYQKHILLYLALFIAFTVVLGAAYILVRKPFSPAPVQQAQQDPELTKEAEDLSPFFKEHPPQTPPDMGRGGSSLE